MARGMATRGALAPPPVGLPPPGAGKPSILGGAGIGALHALMSRDPSEENYLRNTPIQGSAADIVKQAMIDVTRALGEKKMKSRLLLQVHDELIFEVPEAELSQAQDLVKQRMEQAVKLSVPLRVSLEVGPTWGDIH